MALTVPPETQEAIRAELVAILTDLIAKSVHGRIPQIGRLRWKAGPAALKPVEFAALIAKDQLRGQPMLMHATKGSERSELSVEQMRWGELVLKHAVETGAVDLYDPWETAPPPASAASELRAVPLGNPPERGIA